MRHNPVTNHKKIKNFLVIWNKPACIVRCRRVLLQYGFNGGQKVVELFEGLQVGVIGLDLIGAFEQKAGLTGADHSKVVVAIAGGNGLEAAGLQGLYRGILGLFTPHLIAGDLSVLPHLQGITEQGGIAQLFHQGHPKLGEGIA